MFNKKHSEKTKFKISKSMSKYSLGVGIYVLNDNLILKFNNNTELAKHLNISKVTVGKYLNKGLIYKNIYIDLKYYKLSMIIWNLNLLVVL